MVTVMAGIDPADLKILVFDVFGTVVDWRGSILRDLEALGRAKGIAADWGAFVDQWRGGYAPAMQRVRVGELPWTRVDDLHRMILDELLAKHGVTGLSEAETQHLNLAWHRLDPWPDSVAGLRRLKQRFIIGTLSNGNMALLVDMARHAGLPWDVVLSAELVQHYKPDPEAYLMVPQMFGVEPGQVMLVAAHPRDLAGAAGQGLRSCFVPRPLEFGPTGKAHAVDEGKFDVVAGDFNKLADVLDA